VIFVKCSYKKDEGNIFLHAKIVTKFRATCSVGHMCYQIVRRWRQIIG